MKKTSFLINAALCAILTVLTFSCKDKGNADQIAAESVTTEAGNATEDGNKDFQEQKSDSKKKSLIEPVKMEIIDPDILCFYKSGRLCDTMYVTASSGLKVRKEPSMDSETVAKLPHRFPAKIVAVGEKITVSDMSSYWVKIVLPNYKMETAEPSYGWVFGGYLSPSVPDFETPETKDELAAYISARPIVLYNDWITTSRFFGPRHEFFLYPDGKFDAYLFQSDEDMEKIATGTWEADSATHIKLSADSLDFEGFYCYRITDDSFECPDTDSPDDKLIARATRRIGVEFLTDNIINYYKYAYEMNNEMNPGKKYSMFENFSASFNKEQIQTMLASGVDMSGTKYEADYKSYWDPIREKQKVQSVTIKNGGTFSRTLPFGNSGVGSLITPVEGKTFNIYSIPQRDESKICGTITSGEIAIIKNVVVSSFPIPISDVYYKIINTANGNEGWIYIYTDYTDEEIDYLCTYSCKENSDGFEYINRINANVIFRKDQIVTPETGKNVAVSPDGEYLAYTAGSWIYISEMNEENWKSKQNVNQNLDDALIAYSHDGDHIFIVTDRGNFLDYQLSIKDINKEITEAFSFKDANFKYPSRIYVSPDDRFIYVTADKDTYSRRVTKMLIFDTKKEKCYEYDFRAKKDLQDGFYHYSPVCFNSKGEAVYSMQYEGDGVTALLSLDSNDDLTAETFFMDDYFSPMFEASGEDIVFTKTTPESFIKASRKGVILDKTKRYALVENQEAYRLDSEIILHSDKKMAARITHAYDEEHNYLGPYVSVYSLKTLNHLFTFECPDYETPYYEWTGDHFFVLDKERGRGTVFTIKILEKDTQVNLFPNLTAQEEMLYSKNHIIAQDHHNLFLELYPTGIYKISSIEDYGMDCMYCGSFYGPYEWISNNKILLHNATVVPLKYTGHNLEETSEEFKEYMLNIPLLTKGGTLEIDVRFPENDTSAPEVSCWYYAK